MRIPISLYFSYLLGVEEGVWLERGGAVLLPHHLLGMDVAQQQLGPELQPPFRGEILI